MITRLWNLRSTNNGGVKNIHVDVVNDGSATQTQLQVKICDQNVSKDVSLGPEERKEVLIPHSVSGSCRVIVVDSESGKETSGDFNLKQASDG